MKKLNSKLKPNISTIKELAKSLNVSQQKLMDYLRQKGILDYYNQSERGFDDWFDRILHHDYSVRRLDLTTEGLKRIKQEINNDGLDKVINRKSNGRYRKGNKHGQRGYLPRS